MTPPSRWVGLPSSQRPASATEPRHPLFLPGWHASSRSPAKLLPQETFAAQPQQGPAPLGGLPTGLADVFAPGEDNLGQYQSPPTQDQFLEPDDVMLIRAMAEVNPTSELLGLLKFASDRQIGRTQRNF